MMDGGEFIGENNLRTKTGNQRRSDAIPLCLRHAVFARIFNRFLWSEIPIAGDFPSRVRASILQGS
jgi:hypothetical protein